MIALRRWEGMVWLGWGRLLLLLLLGLGALDAEYCVLDSSMLGLTKRLDKAAAAMVRSSETAR